MLEVRLWMLLLRDVLVRSLRSALILLGAAPAFCTSGPAHVRLFNTHTGKRIDVVYRDGETCVQGGLDQLEGFLCDHRNAQCHAFDPALFDILSSLARQVGRSEAEFQVISGFRSPESNETLRATRTGVAKHSLHMLAKAIDIRLPGTPTAKLRDAAIALGLGGVGYYRSLDFIHVDTGRVRTW
jgi:uncharacterized protein YcbK (DUF882 family)